MPQDSGARSEQYKQALPSREIREHDLWMALPVPKHRFNLTRADDWLAVLQWIGDRAFALIASTAGAGVMGYLAKATGWIAAYGPIAWGAIGLVTFAVVYLLLINGRRVLARARLDRAAAMISERAAEHATVNPLGSDFRHQRIRLIDLYTPFGLPITDRNFVDCDLIGPAVVWLSPNTVFRRNTFHNVEYVKINASTAQQWPNKLAIVGGSVERCLIVNTIFLVHTDHAKNFEDLFDGEIQWMNDPPRRDKTPITARYIAGKIELGRSKSQPINLHRFKALEEERRRETSSADLVGDVPLVLWDVHFGQALGQLAIAHTPPLQLALEQVFRVSGPVKVRKVWLRHHCLRDECRISPYSMFSPLTTRGAITTFDDKISNVMTNGPTLPPLDRRSHALSGEGDAYVRGPGLRDLQGDPLG